MDHLKWALLAFAVLMLAGRTRDAWAPDSGPVQPLELDDGSAEMGQASAFDVWSFMATFDPVAYLPPAADAGANVAAFLATIRAAEGTADAEGYRALFGHKPRRPVLFDGFEDHPRQAVRFRDGAGRHLWTSAAGAYQFMAISPLPDGGSTKVNTWDRIRARLALPDFSPASQDAAAVELIREAGALELVQSGRFDDAVSKVRRIWASLPGAGYEQPEKSLASLRVAYASAGGSFA